MTAELRTAERRVEAVTKFAVALLVLALLAYVGYGEASRMVPQLQADKLRIEAGVVAASLDSYLEAGLDLAGYVGFRPMAGRILEADAAITAIGVFDDAGRPIVEAGPSPAGLLAPTRLANGAVDPAALRIGDGTYQVVLPLHAGERLVGQLAISIRRVPVLARIRAVMAPLPVLIVAGALLYGLLAYVAAGWPTARATRWLQLGYAAVFLVVSGVVIAMLVGLYSDGVQAKARSVARSLGERLGAVRAAGLQPSDLTGLQAVLQDYRRLNPDIDAIALIGPAGVLLHDDPALVGKPWTAHAGDLEFDQPVDKAAWVRVALPSRVVTWAVADSAKNFLVLFFATGFIATVAFQLGGALSRALRLGRAARAEPAFALEAVKPVLFIGFFVENLGASFLPQLMQRSATDAGLSSTAASLMFMTYFLCFAASLIPSGQFAARHGAKPLISAGAALAMIGLAVFAVTDHYVPIILGRVASGLGQGMLFIGAQSYILANVAAGRRTQGAGIIVSAFNGGMICGMAIGSLLYNYMGERGVFALAAAITCLGAVFVLSVLPAGRPAAHRAPAAPGRASWRGLLTGDVVKTVLLVGVPAKAVLTGVVIFAMPLVLSAMRLPQEDIGQVMMVYALGVLISSHHIARLADRRGSTREILVWGTVVSGIGLILVGISDGPLVAGGGPVATVACILAGIAVVGLAHGCINAPVVTHVATSRAARAVGEVQASAYYRFVERIGHVAGPVLMGQLLVLGGHQTMVLTWIGGALILFGMIFATPVGNAPRPLCETTP